VCVFVCVCSQQVLTKLPSLLFGGLFLCCFFGVAVLPHSHRNADADVDRTDPTLSKPQKFLPTDFRVGARLRFHHCPDQVWEVLAVDTSTSGLDADSLLDGVVQATAPAVSTTDMLAARVAWRLDGRVASVMKTMEGYDWRVRGGVDVEVAVAVLRKLGVTLDVLRDPELTALCRHFTVDAPGHKAHGLVSYTRLRAALLTTPITLLRPRTLFGAAGRETPPRTARSGLEPVFGARTHRGWGRGTGGLRHPSTATTPWSGGGGGGEGEGVGDGAGAGAGEGEGVGAEVPPATPPRPMYNADSPQLVAAETPVVSEEERVQRRLRLLLGNVSPKLLRHFCRLQDPAHGGFIGTCFHFVCGWVGVGGCVVVVPNSCFLVTGSHCFLVALEQAGLEMSRTDRAFLMRTCVAVCRVCWFYRGLF